MKHQYPHMQTGFTMTELLIAMVIGVYLISVGAPGLLTLMNSNRVTAHVNQLLSAIKYTRTEAITRGIQVRIVATNNNWINGWTITELQDDTVIRIADGFDGVEVEADINSFIFNPSGFIAPGSGALPTTISICPQQVQDFFRKDLTVTFTGQVYVEPILANGRSPKCI